MRNTSSLRGLPGRAKVGTSIAVAAAMLGQLVLGVVANAAVIPSNKVGTAMTAFKLGNNAVFSQNIAGQQTGAGSFANGQIDSYPEGSCVPGLVQIKNKDNAAGDIVFSSSFDYLNTVVGIDHLETVTSSLGSAVATADNLNDLTLGLNDLTNATSFTTLSGGSVSAVITGPVADGVNGNTQKKKYDVTLQNVPAGETVNFLTCARLGTDASQFNGATLSMRLSGGNENIGIQTPQLLVLPKLTITKTVVGGDATPDQFTFTVSPTINGQSVFPMEADGTIVIDNVPVNGSYTITESGAANYTLTSVSGTNCVASGNGASATLASGKPATDAVCTFVNTYQAPPPPPPTTGTVTVTKVVVNDDEGTSQVSDFVLSVGQTQVTSGVSATLTAGSYVVTESGPSGYNAAFSGDCDAQGNLTVVAGNSYACTLTNDDITPPPPPPPTEGNVTVTKIVVGGEASVSDFPLSVGETSVVSGQTNVFPAGSYVVSETNQQNYTGAFSGDCDTQGNLTVVAGESVSCTITNTYQAPPPPPPTTATLTVIKTVVGGELSASAFTLNVTGGNASPASFPGAADGTAVTVDINGEYAVSETAVQNYTASYSEACSGTMTSEGATCTVTNTYQAPPPQETEQNIKVSLVVINDDGGTATPAAFSATVDASAVAFDAATYLNAGNHTVVVSGPTGYSISYSGDCDSSGIVDLAASSSETCTATANDIAQETPPTPPGGGGGGSIPTGTIIVITNVINDDGGSKTASQFNMTVTNGAVTSMVSGSETGNSINFQPGSYTADGNADAAYVKTLSAGCSGTLAANTTVTCTVTYDDVGSGSAPTPPAPPAPQPQVLGATDEEPAAPVPQVLGATDTQLPVTGMPAGALLALALGAIPFTIRRKK